MRWSVATTACSRGGLLRRQLTFSRLSFPLDPRDTFQQRGLHFPVFGLAGTRPMTARSSGRIRRPLRTPDDLLFLQGREPVRVPDTEHEQAQSVGICEPHIQQAWHDVAKHIDQAAGELALHAQFQNLVEKIAKAAGATLHDQEHGPRRAHQIQNAGCQTGVEKLELLLQWISDVHQRVSDVAIHDVVDCVDPKGSRCLQRLLCRWDCSSFSRRRASGN